MEASSSEDKVSNSALVTLSELSTEITHEEYSDFLESQKRQSYTNDAVLQDGVPVSVDYYATTGAGIVSSALTEA